MNRQDDAKPVHGSLHAKVRHRSNRETVALAPKFPLSGTNLPKDVLVRHNNDFGRTVLERGVSQCCWRTMTQSLESKHRTLMKAQALTYGGSHFAEVRSGRNAS
jgi:hypothetical protein